MADDEQEAWGPETQEILDKMDDVLLAFPLLDKGIPHVWWLVDDLSRDVWLDEALMDGMVDPSTVAWWREVYNEWDFEERLKRIAPILLFEWNEMWLRLKDKRNP